MAILCITLLRNESPWFPGINHKRTHTKQSIRKMGSICCVKKNNHNLPGSTSVITEKILASAVASELAIRLKKTIINY